MNIGAQLRQARESRGLSIEDISARTRIQPRLLEALERNDLSVVPPPPYPRGFVAAFAREVGLNADETVREYFGQFAPAPIVIEPVSPAVSTRRIQSRAWAPVLAGVGLVLTIGLLFSNRTQAPRVEEPGPIGTSGTPNTPAEAAVSPRKGTDGVIQASSNPARAADVGPAPGTVVVVLETRSPSWVTAVVDGDRQLYQIVPAGTKTTFRATREITIRVGDAGAVRLSVNGHEPALMGAPGEVRNVKITPGS
jgi:cytoskeletal protein RodZ